jgi:hypothetical protein
MVSTYVTMVLFNPVVNQVLFLLFVGYTTFTGCATHAHCLQSQVVLDWLQEAGDFPWYKANRLDVLLQPPTNAIECVLHAG